MSKNIHFADLLCYTYLVTEDCHIGESEKSKSDVDIWKTDVEEVRKALLRN